MRDESVEGGLAIKSLWVRTGDFFFRYRNALFPLFLVGFFFALPMPETYFGSEVLEDSKDVLAVCVTLFGFVIRAGVIGFANISHGGRGKRVHADRLIQDGFFRTSRNPLYLGNMFIYTGVFLMHGAPVAILLGTAAFFLIYSSIIAAEEFFLRARFGASYQTYCAQVPRWWPALSRIREATRNMRFSVRRVILKDYTVALNIALVLVLLELLESYTTETGRAFLEEFIRSSVFLAVMMIATLAVVIAKKKKWLRA